MDKLTLAHEYAKVLLTQNTTRNVGEVVDCSFALAEAMLVEEEKRRDKSRPAVIEKVDNRDWIEELEFEVDWSQAPNYAKSWEKTRDGSFIWGWCDVAKLMHEPAPSFGYVGHWSNSKKVRP